jgi:hypothetical protein
MIAMVPAESDHLSYYEMPPLYPLCQRDLLVNAICPHSVREEGIF